jgi:hypothetical protein
MRPFRFRPQRAHISRSAEMVLFSKADMNVGDVPSAVMVVDLTGVTGGG